MCVTTVIQFSVPMFFAAETQNQTTQPDGDCSQLSYILACKIPAKLTGMVLCREVQPYILLFCCFTFFLKCYQSLADNTLTGWELTSFRTLLFNHSSKTHQVQIKPEHGKQTDQFYMPWWHHNDIRRIKVCTFSLQFVFQAWEKNKQYSHSTK